ncbi:hypothetical protein [Pseudooceanicola sp. LIPI14-2-Ac024]|uniref:hypothetical protein n=1 Tax=Pseudooceanicola sp. LIPI14-2-Ac024 TaxID=3344875 RepID=UPI0035CFB25F
MTHYERHAAARRALFETAAEAHARRGWVFRPLVWIYRGMAAALPALKAPPRRTAEGTPPPATARKAGPI